MSMKRGIMLALALSAVAIQGRRIKTAEDARSVQSQLHGGKAVVRGNPIAALAPLLLAFHPSEPLGLSHGARGTRRSSISLNTRVGDHADRGAADRKALRDEQHQAWLDLPAQAARGAIRSAKAVADFDHPLDTVFGLSSGAESWALGHIQDPPRSTLGARAVRRKIIAPNTRPADKTDHATADGRALREEQYQAWLDLPASAARSVVEFAKSAAEFSDPWDTVFGLSTGAESWALAQFQEPPRSSLSLQTAAISSKITVANPLKVIISGAGVGGLALANDLLKDPRIRVTVLERTGQFKRFGGPIQLASNALAVLKESDQKVFDQIMEKFTFTGDKQNGIKDGIRDEWYAKFDLGGPADDRGMPYTGVIERPDLQEIYLNALPEGVVKNGDGVASYRTDPDGKGVTVVTESGAEYSGDVVIGADGIWSNVRATMRNEPAKGNGSGASYSGYTVFAGELNYDSYDNGDVGYKVFIGPNQYFVITDIGKGRYQWYAFLGRAPDSAEAEPKPDGKVAFLKDLFAGWSGDVHQILDATREDEIDQRDLYDRPPSVLKSWSDGPAALLGDAVHAMMPNLGQGGCQALEDSFVIAQELKTATNRNQIDDKLKKYRNRRLIRASTVQGLSRFASDIIIKGFDTPAKIVFDGGLKFENFNYAGIVTKLLQPILPVFFSLQFNFLYDGWRNEAAIDYKAALGISLVGFLILLTAAGFDAEVGLGLGAGLEAIFGADGAGALISQIGDLSGR